MGIAEKIITNKRIFIFRGILKKRLKI